MVEKRAITVSVSVNPVCLLQTKHLTHSSCTAPNEAQNTKRCCLFHRLSLLYSTQHIFSDGRLLLDSRYAFYNLVLRNKGVNFKPTRMPYYAVARGRTTGVFNNWIACKDQVNGYPGAIFRKFDSAGSAHDFLESHGCSNCSGGSGYSFDTDFQGYVIVYTDGACFSNGGYGARAGIGVYWGDDHPLNVAEPVYGRQTNITAEIQAATRAMKIAASNGITKLLIVTDSKFLIDSVTKWMPGWKQNGWRVANGGPVRNEQDFRALDQAQNRLNMKWAYVEAHCGNAGNDMADQLAKDGASMA